MRLNRRAFLLGGLCAAFATRAAAAAAAPREVLVFYYGWYGDPSNNPDWRGVDLIHRRTVNTPDFPAAGPYNSHEAAVVERQFRQMKEAGITGLIYSWWGIGSWEDKGLGLVLDTARRFGLHVSLYYEKCPTGAGANPALVTKDLTYLVRSYAGHPAWLRVDGRPVIFLYTTALQALGAPLWRGIVDDVRRDTAADILFNAAAVPGMDLSMFDGLHRYAMVASIGERPPAEARHYVAGFYPDFLRRQAGMRVRTLTVYPGYDDTLLNRPKHLREGRADGELYAVLWSEALKAGPDWVLITSWNEWHEGTEIEPSDQYGDLFLKMTSRYSETYLGHR